MVTFWTAKIEHLFETEKRNGNFFSSEDGNLVCNESFIVPILCKLHFTRRYAKVEIKEKMK